MTLKKTVKQMVEDAEAEIKSLPVLDAMNLLESEDHVFVDLRDVRELDHDGMIPDAFHAPRGMIEFWVDPESPYHKDIFASGKTFVFYCRSGWRSALATKARFRTWDTSRSAISTAVPVPGWKPVVPWRIGPRRKKIKPELGYDCF